MILLNDTEVTRSQLNTNENRGVFWSGDIRKCLILDPSEKETPLEMKKGLETQIFCLQRTFIVSLYYNLALKIRHRHKFWIQTLEKLEGNFLKRGGFLRGKSEENLILNIENLLGGDFGGMHSLYEYKSFFISFQLFLTEETSEERNTTLSGLIG